MKLKPQNFRLPPSVHQSSCSLLVLIWLELAIGGREGGGGLSCPQPRISCSDGRQEQISKRRGKIAAYKVGEMLDSLSGGGRGRGRGGGGHV